MSWLGAPPASVGPHLFQQGFLCDGAALGGSQPEMHTLVCQTKTGMSSRVQEVSELGAYQESSLSLSALLFKWYVEKCAVPVTCTALESCSPSSGVGPNGCGELQS